MKRLAVALALAFLVIGCGGGAETEPLLPVPKTPKDGQKFRELPIDEYRDYMGEGQQE